MMIHKSLRYGGLWDFRVYSNLVGVCRLWTLHNHWSRNPTKYVPSV